MEALDCDVAIIGAGPAGVTLANLLGQYGVSTMLIDRETQILEEPRAVGIDDEALRTLQGFGMAEEVLANAVRNAPIRYYDSHKRILAHVAPSGRPYGWPRRNLFFQPNLEAVLRKSLDRFGTVEMRTGCEAVGLVQDSEGVTVTARQGDDTVTIRARYVIGADGGRSFVREAVNIELEGDTAPMKWLVVDVKDDTWDAPYSAVYTSPKRPSMTIPLPFGYRRFEFKVLDGEDPDRMAEPEMVATLMKQFYPDGEVPEAARRRIYWHHSRTASRFQDGRVFLVGDAAHLQPPFFGQGMNSGMRDVTNLAWKLGMVLSESASPGLLGTYDSERREIARDMVQFATGIGRLYHPANRGTEFIRNLFFRGVQRIPGARDYILQMKYKPTPRYQDGFVLNDDVDSSSPVGRAFPQPVVEKMDGTRLGLDDILGTKIALVGVAGGVIEGLSPEVAARLAAHNGVVVQSHVPSVYRRKGQINPLARDTTSEIPIVDVYDTEGGLRDLYLAHPDIQVYIVRPDRYVAAVSSIADLNSKVESLLTMLGTPGGADAASNSVDTGGERVGDARRPSSR